MMSGHGKLDSPIVPGKFSNKTCLQVAEEMEGRGLAKGSQLEQNAPRTQGRKGVHSALERVREVHLYPLVRFSVIT